jgi:hypothetical protein
MPFHFTTAHCGAGKSHWAINKMIGNVGRYIFVKDKIDAIEETRKDIHSKMVAAGKSFEIEVISSEKLSKTYGSVTIEIDNLANKYRDIDHVIVFITHAAMLISDFSSFDGEGWSIFVDEIPDVVEREEWATPLSIDIFQRFYTLAPCTDKWSVVQLTKQGWEMPAAALGQDAIFSTLRQFHELVTASSYLAELGEEVSARAQRRENIGRKSHVLVDLTSWDQMRDGRQWQWFSIWSPAALAGFNDITFMANGFDQSFSFKLFQQWAKEIEWHEQAIPSGRKFKTRKVRIEYFARDHVASASLFQSASGKANLAKIADHLQHRDMIWTANKVHADTLRKKLEGKELSPKQAGSNKYADMNAAACIYSAKPSQLMRNALRGVIGVDASVWVDTTEYETILQFMCRTSVRNPESTEPVTLTVYDHKQAAYLKSYFERQPCYQTESVCIDLDLTDSTRTAGRPKVLLTADQIAAADATKKAKKLESQRLRRAREKLKSEVGS